MLMKQPLEEKCSSLGEEDLEVKNEEKEGVEFFKFECLGYREEKEGGVRVGEESSVQCPENKLFHVGGACNALSGIQDLKIVGGFTEMEAHRGGSRKVDAGRVYFEGKETRQSIKQIKRATVKIIGREDDLICSGLPKTQLKDDFRSSGFRGLGLKEVEVEQFGYAEVVHAHGYQSEDGED
ncbi:hypothetical protein VNO80_10023 [Phaseolus coccineus]|uniref:Uncharacterized protein n=1 Tax=Phaseolus coccineus TaxID=3886 RepID=A0AAN9RD38_PHACN